MVVVIFGLHLVLTVLKHLPPSWKFVVIRCRAVLMNTLSPAWQ